MSETYIEVFGKSSYRESVKEYHAALLVSAQGARKEAAFDESFELRTKCVQLLRNNGLEESEIREGGSESYQPWFWKKRVGQQASQKILISTPDFSRLMQGLAALEFLFNGARHTFSFTMLSPDFWARDEDVVQARHQAMAEARAQATMLAETDARALGRVIQVQELDHHVQRSGSFVNSQNLDADRVDDDEDSPSQAFGASERMVRMCYRVRYALV